MAKFIKLKKRYGGVIYINSKHITAIETYSYRNDCNGHLSYFSSLTLLSGDKIEVSEVDEYIIGLCADEIVINENS